MRVGPIVRNLRQAQDAVFSFKSVEPKKTKVATASFVAFSILCCVGLAHFRDTRAFSGVVGLKARTGRAAVGGAWGVTLLLQLQV
jgi:hypothetical protein